ncbi:MAG TPA: hypothetical protein VNI82_00295 [Candidatus Nitrosotenuis sp.]|nr:hypothetical protein [Candidatus Nitrosotenuis sp.]
MHKLLHTKRTRLQKLCLRRTLFIMFLRTNRLSIAPVEGIVNGEPVGKTYRAQFSWLIPDEDGELRVQPTIFTLLRRTVATPLSFGEVESYTHDKMCGLPKEVTLADTYSPGYTENQIFQRFIGFEALKLLKNACWNDLALVNRGVVVGPDELTAMRAIKSNRTKWA